MIKGIPAPRGPIGKVHAGMRVVAADGETIGIVVHVTTGDAPRPHPAADQSLRWAERAFAGPASGYGRQAERLMSGGFLKVLGTGPQGIDRYVSADQISEVDNDTVLLKVGRDHPDAQG